jgi:phosphonate transport system substrate-binding protein
LFQRLYRLLATCVAVCFLAALPAPALAEIRLAILPRLEAADLFTMFNPLAEYLSKETGEKVSIVIPKDFTSFKSAAREGMIDLCFANSLVYVQLRKDIAAEPLAVAFEQNSGDHFRGIVIARKDSGIVSLGDLRGKKMVFVDKDSAGGYLFQVMMLKKAGLEMGRDITLLPFAKKHDNVVQAVINGAADAGGLRENDLDRMRNIADLSRIWIVAYSDYYPNWPLFSLPGMQPGKQARVKEALLKLKPGKRRSSRVLESAGLKGFAPITNTEYDRLREAARLAGAL